jgi:hypothetical protein
LLQKAIRCPLAMSLQWPCIKRPSRCPLAMSLQWPLLKRPSDVHCQIPSNGHLMVSGPLIPIRWVYFHYGEHYHDLVSTNLATIAECDGTGNGSDLNVDLPSLPELIAAQNEDKRLKSIIAKCSQATDGTFTVGRGNQRTFFLRDGLLLCHASPVMLFQKQSKRRSDRITQTLVFRSASEHK